MKAAQRYLLLGGVVVGLGAVLSGLARLPHHASSTHSEAHVAPHVNVAVTISDAGVSDARVPSGSDVTLTLANQRDTEVVLDLAGYTDRLGVQHVPAHGRATLRFLADRPGDDFAWMLNGQPAGRFAVTGSHLQEGHQ